MFKFCLLISSSRKQHSEQLFQLDVLQIPNGVETHSQSGWEAIISS